MRPLKTAFVTLDGDDAAAAAPLPPRRLGLVGELGAVLGAALDRVVEEPPVEAAPRGRVRGRAEAAERHVAQLSAERVELLCQVKLEMALCYDDALCCASDLGTRQPPLFLSKWHSTVHIRGGALLPPLLASASTFT